jgi:hypothetical protein
MRRLLLWLLISVAAWEGLVYLYYRPRFWEALARTSVRVGQVAISIHGKTLEAQARRALAGADTRTGMGNTITSIEDYLQRKRSPSTGDDAPAGPQ